MTKNGMNAVITVAFVVAAVGGAGALIASIWGSDFGTKAGLSVLVVGTFAFAGLLVLAGIANFDDEKPSHLSNKEAKE